MIIARAPYRVSFFGGGSDLPDWYSRHGGEVLSCTLDRFCYIGVRRTPEFLDGRFRVSWARLEICDSIDQIEHSGARGCLQATGETEGVEIIHMGDLPARSGVGSSSSFTVALLQALHSMRGRYVTKRQLADQAIHVEQDILGETVGIQDQIAAAYGGLNHITIQTDGRYEVERVILRPGLLADFQRRFVLIYTGIQRTSSDIQEDHARNARRREVELRSIAALVPKALAAMKAGNFDEFGALMHESWLLKRQLSDKIATSEINALYDRAIEAGAQGGKVLGAGEGGVLMFYGPDPARIRAEFRSMIEIPFSFGNDGASVALYAP